MGTPPTDKEERRQGLQDLWRLALALVGVVAVVQELRRPPDQRAWHGKVWGVFPYDFRKPSVARIRAIYWNPGGPILSPRVWGVGWTLNLGAIKSRLVSGTERR